MSTTLTVSPNRINKAEAFKLRYKNCLTYQEIADHYGVTKEAAYQAIQSLTKHLPDPEEVEAYRQNKSEILDGVERVLVSNLLNPAKLKEASLNNVAYSFQQVATQNRLEKGLATERIDSFSVTASLDELSRRKQELMDKVLASVQPVVLDTVSTPSITTNNQDK